MDQELRRLERLAETGDEDALLALSRMRLRKGWPPLLQAYGKQLKLAEQEVKDLKSLGSEHLLGMLAEVFRRYYQKYEGVIEQVLWRRGTRLLSHTGQIMSAHTPDRIVGWNIEGPYVQFESNLAEKLSAVMPFLGAESTNFPRGPQAVSVIDELRIPSWDDVILLRRLTKGFNLTTQDVLGHLSNAAQIRAAVKDLLILNPHLENIKSLVSDYLHRIMERTRSEFIYFSVRPGYFELYPVDYPLLKMSIPFDEAI